MKAKNMASTERLHRTGHQLEGPSAAEAGASVGAGAGGEGGRSDEFAAPASRLAIFPSAIQFPNFPGLSQWGRDLLAIKSRTRAPRDLVDHKMDTLTEKADAKMDTLTDKVAGLMVLDGPGGDGGNPIGSGASQVHSLAGFPVTAIATSRPFLRNCCRGCWLANQCAHTPHQCPQFRTGGPLAVCIGQGETAAAMTAPDRLPPPASAVHAVDVTAGREEIRTQTSSTHAHQDSANETNEPGLDGRESCLPGGCSPELLGAGVVAGSADAIAATGEVARTPPPTEADRADLIPAEPEVGTGELSDAKATILKTHQTATHHLPSTARAAREKMPKMVRDDSPRKGAGQNFPKRARQNEAKISKAIRNESSAADAGDSAAVAPAPAPKKPKKGGSLLRDFYGDSFAASQWGPDSLSPFFCEAIQLLDFANDPPRREPGTDSAAAASPAQHAAQPPRREPGTDSSGARLQPGSYQRGGSSASSSPASSSSSSAAGGPAPGHRAEHEHEPGQDGEHVSDLCRPCARAEMATGWEALGWDEEETCRRSFLFLPALSKIEGNRNKRKPAKKETDGKHKHKQRQARAALSTGARPRAFPILRRFLRLVANGQCSSNLPEPNRQARGT
eukprot:g3017.t1